MNCCVCVQTDPRSPPYNSPKNASISQSGSIVTVNCHPDDETASCVVVYRAYGNSTLNVVEKFDSLTVTLETGNYTFAIFRRTNDNDIDDKPFISQMVVVGETVSLSSPPSSGTGKFLSKVWVVKSRDLFCEASEAIYIMFIL